MMWTRGMREREGKSLINFGVSVGHIPIRMSVMHDPGALLANGRCGAPRGDVLKS